MTTRLVHFGSVGELTLGGARAEEIAATGNGFAPPSPSPRRPGPGRFRALWTSAKAERYLRQSDESPFHD